MRDEDERRRTEEAKPQNLKHNHTVYTYEVPTRRTAVGFTGRNEGGWTETDASTNETRGRGDMAIDSDSDYASSDDESEVDETEFTCENVRVAP